MGKIASGLSMGAKAAGKAAAKTDQEALVEAAKAADRAAAGRRSADVTKATAPMKMSEALGNLNVEGKGKLKVTQSDRTRVGGGNIGGAMFPGLSQVDPFYEGLVWGVGKKGTASSLINQSDPNTFWTTILGKEDQLKSNPLVFNRLYDAFKREAKAGLLDDELRQKINAGLEPEFGKGADILDPKLRQKINTFDKRVLVADLLLGKGIGGEQRGGSIIPGSAILRQETEPLLLHTKQGGDVPTFAVGPRLFSLSGEVKERPDLHPGFPFLLTGEDTGMVFKPVPGEEAMIDFMTRMQEAGKKPGYYEWTMGEAGRGLPSQDINEAYLTYLQKKGYAEGGAIDHDLKPWHEKNMASGGKAKEETKESEPALPHPEVLKYMSLDDLVNPEVNFPRRYPGQTAALPSDLASDSNKEVQDRRLKHGALEAVNWAVRNLPQPVNPVLQSLRNIVDARKRRLGAFSLPPDIMEASGILILPEELTPIEDKKLSAPRFKQGGDVGSPDGIPEIAQELEAELQQYQVGGAIRRAAASAAKKLSKADIKNVASELERSTGALPEIAEKYPFIRDASVAEIESIAKGSPINAYRALSIFEGAPIKPETTPSTSIDPLVPFNILAETPVVIKGNKFMSPEAVVRTYEGIEPTSTKVYVPSMIEEISERQPEALEMPYRFRSGEKGQVKDVFDIVKKEKELIADVTKLAPKDEFFKAGDGFGQSTYLNVARYVLSGKWDGAEEFLKYQHFTDKPAAIHHLDEFAKSIQERYGKAEGGSIGSPDVIPAIALDLEKEYQSYAAGGPVHMQIGGQPPMDEIGYMMEAIDPTKESTGSPTFEAVKFMAPQIAKSLVSPFVGAYGTLTSGKYGTPEGIRAGEAAMEKFMLPGEVNLSPEAEEKVMQAAKFMEELETKYKLPPLMPELFGPVMGTRGIGTQVKSLAKDAAGTVRDMAKELPPIPAGLSIQPVGQTTEQWLKSLEIPPKPQGSKMEIYAPADDLGLYSKMEKAALNFKRKEGTGEAWLADFKNAGVSDEELEYSGMKDILARITQPMKRETIAVYAKQKRMPLQVVRATEGTDSRDFKFREAEVIDDTDYINGRAADIEADFDNEYPGGTDALRARIMQDFTDEELNDPNILDSIEETVQRNIKQEAYDRAYTEYYDNPYYKSYNDAGYEIVGNRDVGFTVKDPNGEYLTRNRALGVYPAQFDSLEIAESFANQHAIDTGLMRESDVKYSKYQLDRGTDYEEMKIILPQPPGKRSFHSSHWEDEEDVLSHYRTQRRVDTSGKEMLYIDEVQSDWHQAGRDYGYFGKAEQEKFADLEQQAKKARDREAVLRAEKRQLFKRIDSEVEANPPAGAKDLLEVSIERYNINPEAQKIEKELSEIVDELSNIREKFKEFKDQVPDAPFKDTWHELTVKTILHDAAQKGFERVGFSAAKPHIDRWGTEVFAWEKSPKIEETFENFKRYLESLGPLDTPITEVEMKELFADKADSLYKNFKDKVDNSGGWRVVSQEQRGGQAGGVNLEAEARARGILKGKTGQEIKTRDDLKQIVEDTLRDPTELKVERITNKVWKSMNKTDVGIHEPRKEGMQFFYDEALKKYLQKYAKKIGAEFYETETKTGRGVSDEGPKDITEKVYMIEFTPKAKDTAIKGQPYKKGGLVNKRIGGPVYSPFNTKPDISDAGQILDFGMEQELKRYG